MLGIRGILGKAGLVAQEDSWQRWLGDRLKSATAGRDVGCGGPAILSGLALET